MKTHPTIPQNSLTKYMAARPIPHAWYVTSTYNDNRRMARRTRNRIDVDPLSDGGNDCLFRKFIGPRQFRTPSLP